MTSSSDSDIFYNVSVENMKHIKKLLKQTVDLFMDNLEWELLNADNFSSAAKLVVTYFLTEEPAAVATKICDNPIAVEEFLLYCAYVALDGISLVIKNCDTHEVVACAFNKLVTRPPKDSNQHFFEVFGEKYLTQPESKALIVDFCVKTEQTNIFDKFGIECSLEQVIFSVNPDYRSRKLAYMLQHFTTDTALMLDKGPVSSFNIRDLGPKYAKLEAVEPKPLIPPEAIHAICTNYITQEIGEKYDGIVVDVIPFSDIVYNGKTYEELLNYKGATAKLIVLLRKNWLKAYRSFL